MRSSLLQLWYIALWLLRHVARNICFGQSNVTACFISSSFFQTSWFGFFASTTGVYALCSSFTSSISWFWKQAIIKWLPGPWVFFTRWTIHYWLFAVPGPTVCTFPEINRRRVFNNSPSSLIPLMISRLDLSLRKANQKDQLGLLPSSASYTDESGEYGMSILSTVVINRDTQSEVQVHSCVHWLLLFLVLQ